LCVACSYRRSLSAIRRSTRAAQVPPTLRAALSARRRPLRDFPRGDIRTTRRTRDQTCSNEGKAVLGCTTVFAARISTAGSQALLPSSFCVVRGVSVYRKCMECAC